MRNEPCLTSSSNSGLGSPSSRNADSPTRSPKTSQRYGDESVSVAVEEVTSAERGEKVYRQDIVQKAATLYKKPGYTM
jgi:4-oxalocrotonate tautomerase